MEETLRIFKAPVNFLIYGINKQGEIRQYFVVKRAQSWIRSVILRNRSSCNALVQKPVRPVRCATVQNSNFHARCIVFVS